MSTEQTSKTELSSKYYDVNKARKVIDFYLHCLKIGLQYEYGDIVFSEWMYPYMIDSSSNVYEYPSPKNPEQKIKFEDIFKAKYGESPLTKDDLWQLFIDLQSLSVLSGLSERFVDNLWVDFAIRINGTKLRCNLSYYKGRNIELVSRIIKSDEARTLEQLWLISETNTVYKWVLNNMEWLILVVWPTGSGKSTTLTAMIDEINRTSKKHIISLEDPVEYEHKSKQSTIIQREVGTDVTSYQAGMKFILRQKPHIALVWETRDWEVMKTLIELSQTWHLCMTTFHAKSVQQTISRMEAFYPADEKEGFLQDLSEVLIAIFVQRLIPRKWGWKVLLKEIVVTTPEIRKAIATRNYYLLKGNMKTGSSYWMVTIDQSLLDLYEKDLITKETFANYADDKEFAKKYTGISF